MRTITRPSLFENSFTLPQLRLFGIEDFGWLKALKVGEYAPRRRRTRAIQEVLFPYLETL